LSRVLAYTAPARGDLFPLVPILAELRRRGHEVAVRTLAGAVGMLREQGFDAAPVDPAVEAVEMDDWRARTPPGAIVRASRRLAERAPLQARDLERAIEEERPDALLVDLLAWGALVAAEGWGGPWATSCPFPLPLRSAGLPPPGPGLPPARGCPGRLRDRLLRGPFFAAFDRIALPALGALREERGLRPWQRAAELFTTAPLLLHLTAEPFEYPRGDWPSNLRTVGPCSWEPPGELPDDLAAVDAPLVLVTTSTEFQDDGRLISTALEALAGERCHVVATGQAGADARPRTPANATVLEFAPHGPILDRAACAVTHGGMGATQKALARGVPVCAVPFGRDQFEVARRVVVAGAGTSLPGSLLTPSLLRRRVREAVRRRPGAERLARAFASAGGPVAAADAFERIMMGRRGELVNQKLT
jgi:MGT family glycosyltransferase